MLFIHDLSSLRSLASAQTNALVGLNGVVELALEGVEEGIDLLLTLQVDPFMGAAEHLADADVGHRLGHRHRAGLANFAGGLAGTAAITLIPRPLAGGYGA